METTKQTAISAVSSEDYVANTKWIEGRIKKGDVIQSVFATVKGGIGRIFVSPLGYPHFLVAQGEYTAEEIDAWVKKRFPHLTRAGEWDYLYTKNCIHKSYFRPFPTGLRDL